MQTHKYSVLQHFPALQWKHFRNVFYKEKVPSSSAPLSEMSRAVPFSLLPLLSIERAGHRRTPSACSSLPVPQKLHVPVTTLWLVLTLSQPNEELKLTAWVSGFKKQAWSMPVLTSSCSSSQMRRIPPYRKPFSRSTTDAQNHLLYHSTSVLLSSERHHQCSASSRLTTMASVIKVYQHL